MSGDSGQTSTTFQGPPQYIQDYGRDFLGRASQVSQLPYEGYQAPRVAGLSPMTRYGMQGMADMGGGTNYTGAAGNMLTETLNGGGMNPYQDGVVNRALGVANRNYQDQTGAITARFNRPGNWGGSAHMDTQSRANEDFARGSTDAAAQVYQSGYENERGRQMQAAGLAPSLYGSMMGGFRDIMGAGQLDQQNQQALYDSQYGDWREWRDYPQQQLGVFGDALRAAMGAGGQSSTTQGPGPDQFSQGIGLAMLGRSLGSGKTA